MARLVIALSGAMCSGKSRLAELLAERFGTVSFSTSEYLRQLGAGRERAGQQQRGDELDVQGGKWVADGLAQFVAANAVHQNAVVIVDAVRRPTQVRYLRAGFGRARVVHIHLRASSSDLDARCRGRASARDASGKLTAARAHPAEVGIDELAGNADIVVETTGHDDFDVAVIIGHRLGLFASPGERLVDVVVGGEYGSEGKGNIASYLAREYGLLVRVGGPNAGHKVRLEAAISGHGDTSVFEDDEGPVYTHHHLPSGTRTSNARVLIGPGAVLNLERFLREVNDSGLDVERLAIDPQALLIEPRDQRAERSLFARIGSTAQGVGAAAARRIMDRGARIRLAHDVPELKPYLRWAVDVLEQTFRQGERVMLEGTQGVGLSVWHGSYPWVTSRDTSVSGCCAEAGIPPARVRRVVMTCRTYPIRVESPSSGWSGPMRWRPPFAAPKRGTLSSGELTWEEIAKRSGVPLAELVGSERTSTTDRRRRVGEFDWLWLHRAAALNRPTDVALTFADYLSVRNRQARRFDQLTEDTIKFIEQVEAVADAPVSLISTKFSRQTIIDRRRW